MSSVKSRRSGLICYIVFQGVIIVLFVFFVRYDGEALPPSSTNPSNSTSTLDEQYPMFQDVHVMIFVGFGFLMTFLKKYAYSALGFTFFISAVVIQWALLVQGFFHLHSVDERIHLNITSLLNADIVAAVILISFGAVLGKTSAIQLFVMAIIETVFFGINEFLGLRIFQVVDAGGSVFVHVFGAYFGLGVSFVVTQGIAAENEEENLEEATYHSDVHAMIGTLFLWMFWPSFTAALLSGDEKHRAVINTYLALTSSCVVAFTCSALLRKDQDPKFDMVHVQNATLAGGVSIGTVVNMIIFPAGALLIGAFAGLLSSLGYRFVQGYLLRKLRIHDTCGVHNLHGMPGVVSGILGVFLSLSATPGTYGAGLYSVFPPVGPPLERTPGQQAGFQIIGLLITLLFSMLSGLTTGMIIRKFGRIENKFDDEEMWHLPPEENPPVLTAAI